MQMTTRKAERAPLHVLELQNQRCCIGALRMDRGTSAEIRRRDAPVRQSGRGATVPWKVRSGSNRTVNDPPTQLKFLIDVGPSQVSNIADISETE